MNSSFMEFIQRGPRRRVDRHDIPIIIHPRQSLPRQMPKTLCIFRVVYFIVQRSPFVIFIFVPENQKKNSRISFFYLSTKIDMMRNCVEGDAFYRPNDMKQKADTYPLHRFSSSSLLALASTRLTWKRVRRSNGSISKSASSFSLFSDIIQRQLLLLSCNGGDFPVNCICTCFCYFMFL